MYLEIGLLILIILVFAGLAWWYRKNIIWFVRQHNWQKVFAIIMGIVIIGGGLLVFGPPEPPGPVGAGWWDTDWSYHKQISVSDTENSYQMFLNVSKATGNTVNCSDHCNTNFSDLRFLNKDNDTICDYWVENKTDGNYAHLWVEVPSTIETDGYFNMYYGNTSAAPVSNGTNTFTFFDDFDTFDTNVWNWSVVEGEISDPVNSILALDDDDIISSKTEFAYPNAYHIYINCTEQDSYWLYLRNDFPLYENYSAMGNSDTYSPEDFDEMSWGAKKDNGVAYHTEIDNWEDFRVPYYVYSYIRNTSSSVTITQGNYGDSYLHQYENTTTAVIPICDLSIGCRVFDSSAESTIKIKWCFVRDYIYPEPSVSTVGGEQSQNGNDPPVISNVYPVNNSYGTAGFTPTLNIDVYDADGDDINITWQWYNDSVWHTFGTNLSATCNRTFYQPFNNATEYNRDYVWQVLVNDGHDNWNNKSYNFVADIIFINDPNNPILESGSNTLCTSPDVAYNAQNDSWHLFYTRKLAASAARDIYRCDLTDINQSSISYPGTLILQDGTYRFWICSILKYIENNTAVYEGGKYWMYFTSGNGYDIYYATADYLDGDWTIHSTAIINNTGQAWHNTFLGRLGLCAKKDTDGNYILMYDGQDSDTEDSLGYATSTDRTSWTEYAGNPVMAPGHTATGGEPPDQPWDDDWLEYPYLFKRPGNGNYYIIYTGQFRNTTGTTWSAERLGYANSTDMNTWTTYDWNPIFNETTGDWDNNDTSDPTLAISANGTTTYLYYEGEDSVTTGYYSIGRAWSNVFDDVFPTYIYNTTIRNDGEDYFVWLGDNTTASVVGNNIAGFDDSAENISIWRNGTWGDSIGNWVTWTGTGGGTDFNIKTFDVVRVYLTDSGTQLVNMSANPNITYSASRGVSLLNNSVTKGGNYTGYTDKDSTNLSNIVTTAGLDSGEYLTLWNETNYDWDWYIVGFYEPDIAVHEDDVIFTKVEDTESWTIGGK